MRLYTTGISDVGNVRTNNEDSIFCRQLKTGDYLFVVADGMGGHNAGEVASRRAVTELVTAVEGGLPEPVPEALGAAIERINSGLYDDNQRTGPNQRMGTTLTVMLARGSQAYVAHVGDSRLYRSGTNGRGPDDSADAPGQTLTRLTDDHSAVGALLKEGAISEAEARVHPKRSVLSQAIGMRANVTPQLLGPIDMRPGDKFLLCSDGLSSVIATSAIEESFAIPSTALIARSLINRAKAAGGPDNISVIVIGTEPDAVSPASADTTPETDSSPHPEGQQPATRQPLRWFLLGLLVLLLAAVIYVLVHSSADSRSRPAGPRSAAPERSTEQTARAARGAPRGD